MASLLIDGPVASSIVLCGRKMANDVPILEFEHPHSSVTSFRRLLMLKLAQTASVFCVTNLDHLDEVSSLSSWGGPNMTV